MRVDYKTKDGTLLHDLVSARTVQFKGEECILNVATVINPLIETQRALEAGEKRNRVILEAAPDPICLTRLIDGRFIEANSAFYQLTGYTPEETNGKTSLELSIYAKSDDRERFLKAVMKTGHTDGVEISARNKDGTLSTQLWSGRVVEFDGEECLLVVVKPIDEVKRVQQTLQEREASYRTILDTAPYTICITRLSDNTYTEVNHAFTRHTGYSREESLGRTPQELNVYENFEDRDRMLATLRREGRVRGMEVRFRARNGNITENLVAVSPIVYHGEQCRLVMTVDISDLKRAHRALQKKEAQDRQQLEAMVLERTHALEEAQQELVKRERLSALGQLTATVSHELRNPLARHHH